MTETLRFLLDTSIVSAPATREPNRRLVGRIESHGPRCAIAAPIWHELVYGCQRLPRGKRRNALEEYVSEVVGKSFPILPYDEAAAAWHASARADLEAAGRTPPFVDGQIAAIAATRALTLVTANTKDFAIFSGLDVTDWTKAKRR